VQLNILCLALFFTISLSAKGFAFKLGNKRKICTTKCFTTRFDGYKFNKFYYFRSAKKKGRRINIYNNRIPPSSRVKVLWKLGDDFSVITFHEWRRKVNNNRKSICNELFTQFWFTKQKHSETPRSLTFKLNSFCCLLIILFSGYYDFISKICSLYAKR